jgi:hypothetical protein
MDKYIKDPNTEDIWFAWFPVRLGALGTDTIAWLKNVWRNRCGGVTIYQSLSIFERDELDKFDCPECHKHSLVEVNGNNSRIFCKKCNFSKILVRNNKERYV